MDESIWQTIAGTFQCLEGAIDRAIDIIPVREPAELARLVPDNGLPARQLILAELIKLDMAKASERGQLRTLAFYAVIFAEFQWDGKVPSELERAEAKHRRLLGEVNEPAIGVMGLLDRPPEFEPGSQVDDFIIVRTLGRGSFASVYLARQISMQRLVALKVSRRGSEEPIALSQLDHSSIVRVYDQRQLIEPPAVLLYMQYVPGGTLADVIRSTKVLAKSELAGQRILDSIDSALLDAGQQVPEDSGSREHLMGLDWPRAVAWLGIQLAEGIATAHQCGIMHRDVKPANILLDANGVPKLADFNVSYRGEAGGAGAALYFGGSLAYMSPEQLQAVNPCDPLKPKDLDPRSDLYSLGLVLWEVWQGDLPVQPLALFSSWQAAIEQQIELRHKAPRLQRPTETAPERALEKTLRRLLQHDRESRPQNGYEIAGRLRLALADSAAEYFEPADTSWYARIRRLPVLLTTSLVIFIPNGLAGTLNYQYNLASIRDDHLPALNDFVNLSIWLNCIAFPLGGLILIFLASYVQGVLRRAGQERVPTEAGIAAVWNLGHRAAMVGGLLWILAGLVFPWAMNSQDPTFTLFDAVEFFLSLAICGGIAWIYPFFGISLLATEVYYPAVLAPTMVDQEFEQRSVQLKRRATIYLGSAAAIPLFALGLLVVQQSLGASRHSAAQFLLVIIVLTAVALLFAFMAHQRLCDTLHELRSVLAATKRTSRQTHAKQ